MRKGLFQLFLLLFIFNLNIVSSYAVDNQQLNGLINDLKGYFLDYYEKAGADDRVVAPEEVLSELKSIIKDNITVADLTAKFQRINSLPQLSNWLNWKFNGTNRAVVIFVMPDLPLINCWLGELVFDNDSFKEIYGKKYHYQLMVLDKLLIHDYLYYKNGQKDAIGFVTKDNIICCNNEALKQKVKERWDFLLSRYKRKITNYNPSKSDKLRRRFISLAWEDLFLKIIRQNKSKEARKIFFKEAQNILLEVGLYHEIGHIVADSQGGFEDDRESEIIALLTELSFGPMPYESLNTVLSFAWEGHWLVYIRAGQYIIRDFVNKLERSSSPLLPEIKYKGVRKNTLLEKQNILYYLTSRQIRQLANEGLKEILSKNEKGEPER